MDLFVGLLVPPGLAVSFDPLQFDVDPLSLRSTTTLFCLPTYSFAIISPPVAFLFLHLVIVSKLFSPIFIGSGYCFSLCDDATTKTVPTSSPAVESHELHSSVRYGTDDHWCGVTGSLNLAGLRVCNWLFMQPPMSGRDVMKDSPLPCVLVGSA